MAAKTSHKKWIYVFPVFIVIIPAHLLLSKVGDPSPPELNCQDPYPSSRREIKFRRRLFTSSIKCNIKQFHVVVM